MRSWMFESAKMILVHHGGSNPVEMVKPPFFVCPEREMAESYAVERGAALGSHGVITSFEFRPRKTAGPDHIEQTVKELGFEYMEPVFYWLSPSVLGKEAEAVVETLIAKGYDSAVFNDLGMNCPFTEYETYCVFDPSTLKRSA